MSGREAAVSAMPLCKLRVASGFINLKRINDTVYTVDFTPFNECPELSTQEIDLDYIEVDETKHTVSMKNYDWNERKEFHALDPAELKLFNEAKMECEAITTMRLRLGSVFREAYYSGLYSRVSPDDKLIVSAGVDVMRKKSGATFFKSLTHPDAAMTTKPRLSSTKRKAPPSGLQHFIEDINCLYCRSAKVDCGDLIFYIHPYVSMLFDRKPIYFCKTCIEAWKEYRTNVEHDNELVLEDEINEEICALCSDSPETLILCSLCPRSYCHSCLQKSLPAETFHTVTTDNETDWICMSCSNKQMIDPPLQRSAWKQVEPVVRRHDRTSQGPLLAPAKAGSYHSHSRPSIRDVGANDNSSKAN